MNESLISAGLLEDQVQGAGFAFVSAPEMRALLERAGDLADWADFAASWNDLALDTYMADRGRYRRRRHAVYRATGEEGLVRQPHQPHYQGLDYNPLNGGVERWFEPVLPAIGGGPSLRTILAFCHDLFDRLAGAKLAWHVEIHQFRIEARSGEAGQPTPEGAHRDGVDYVLVLLIDRQNIKSGVTTIEALDHRPLGSFTLTNPMDAALVEDARVYHGVTAVEPLDPSLPGHRDVLVVTFRAERD
ncbi:MAG TPA: 2OG-Fe dioxygenase family protein [Aliidongia sp.]|nr:2OG-Fe dioxygenase family protein [Aliidongia sp.]